MYFAVMQGRLAEQQKAMAEERAYLKEIISRMDTQLNEQQRQLEKVRVKTDIINRLFASTEQYSTYGYIETSKTKIEDISLED